MDANYKLKYLKYKNKYCALKRNIDSSKQIVDNINNLNYKNKYFNLRLKYLNIFDGIENPKDFQTSNKNKYCALKRNIDSSKQTLKGGANCPMLGFYQHRGECWHDAMSMILLYSDELSEHFQTIFDNDFDVTDCIEYAKSDVPYFLMLINIEPKDYEMLYENARIYFSELYSRYMNEKLPIKKIFKKISDKSSITTLFRINSISETIGCTDTIYQITNTNLNPKYIREWKQYEHGGTIAHDITIISLFNYFLLNYFPEKLKLEKQLKFINMNVIQLVPSYKDSAKNI